MPAFCARSAIALPTVFAASTLPPVVAPSPFLFVDAAQSDRRLVLIDRRFCTDTLGFGLDAVGQNIFDRMRIAESKNYLSALDIGLVTDADDIEVLRKSLGHADDGVICQSSRK